MSEELQSLLDRIQSEGVNKAEQKAKEIISEAERKAAAIVEAARKQSSELVSSAEAEAKVLRDRSEQSLKQAARDVVLKVGKSIQDTLERVLLADVKAELSGEFLHTYLEQIAKSSEAGATLMVAPDAAEALAAFARARLADAVAKGMVIAGSSDVDSGISVRIQGGRIEHDFTDKAVVEALSKLIRPSLAKIVFGE